MIHRILPIFLVLSMFLQPLLPAVEGIFLNFPKNVEEMRIGFERTKDQAETQIEQILLIHPNERTFENTALAYDRAAVDFQIFCSAISLMKLVHPSPEIRLEAEKLLLDLTALNIDLFESHQGIYKAIDSLPKKDLSSEREYYLSKLLSSFKRSGILLPSEDVEQMKRLQNKIAALSLQFRTHIDEDERVLRLKKEELLGLDDPFIQNFQQEGDEFIIPSNANSASQILRECRLAATRKKCFQVYRERAFPENLTVLKDLIETRHKLALLLGYKNYAEMDLSDQMAKTAERVHAFIQELGAKNNEKIQNNWKLILQELPESVVLTPDGKVNPWDAPYLLTDYSKKHFDVDPNKIAEYFPFQPTLEAILDLFSQFFALEFRIVPQEGLWDPSVIVVEVKDEGTLIGHILLDLFPRKNKFSHACCSSIIPPISKDGGKTFEPALAAIVANLSRPDLFKTTDLKTFLHEFGHAMHALLGRSEMATQAAYNTPIDFVEAPSQLLEEWSFNRAVLKKISCHYQTGEPLPDFMIEGLKKSRNFGDGGHYATGGSGDHIVSLLQFALFSLKIHEGSDCDFMALDKEIYQNSPQVIAYKETPYFCAIGHLASYASKYYCYGWSKQLALQMYDYIATHGGPEGPLDPAMGKRYRSKVIGRGGSCDPNELMADFLQD
jgi:thimet oligopeptidase